MTAKTLPAVEDGGAQASRPLLRVENLIKHFGSGGGLLRAKQRFVGWPTERPCVHG